MMEEFTWPPLHFTSYTDQGHEQSCPVVHTCGWSQSSLCGGQDSRPYTGGLLESCLARPYQDVQLGPSVSLHCCMAARHSSQASLACACSPAA